MAPVRIPCIVWGQYKIRNIDDSLRHCMVSMWGYYDSIDQKTLVQWYQVIRYPEVDVNTKIARENYMGSSFWPIDRLVQEKGNCIVNALELCLPCTNPSICAKNCSGAKNHIGAVLWYDWVFLALNHRHVCTIVKQNTSKGKISTFQWNRT